MKVFIPTMKFSFKAHAKWRNSVYVLTEICHQISKWLGPMPLLSSHAKSLQEPQMQKKIVHVQFHIFWQFPLFGTYIHAAWCSVLCHKIFLTVRFTDYRILHTDFAYPRIRAICTKDVVFRQISTFIEVYVAIV